MSKALVRGLLVSSLVAASIVASAGTAQAASGPAFQSKSGAFVCEYITGLGGPPLLLCQSRRDALTAFLSAGSRPTAEYGGVTRRAGKPVLSVGGIWTRGSYRCQMGAGSVRCWSKGTKDDSAFVLGPGSFRRSQV